MSHTPTRIRMYMSDAAEHDSAWYKDEYERKVHGVRERQAHSKREAEKADLASRFDRLNLTPAVIVGTVDDELFRRSARYYEEPPLNAVDDARFRRAAKCYEGKPSHHDQPTHYRQPSHSTWDHYAVTRHYEDDFEDDHTTLIDGEADHITLIDGEGKKRHMHSTSRKVLHEEVTHDDSISCLVESIKTGVQCRTTLGEEVGGRGCAGFRAVDKRSDVAGPGDKPHRQSRRPTRRHSQIRRDCTDLEHERERQHEGKYKPGPGQYGYAEPRARPIPPAVPIPPPAAGYDYNRKYEQQVANCSRKRETY